MAREPCGVCANCRYGDPCLDLMHLDPDALTDKSGHGTTWQRDANGAFRERKPDVPRLPAQASGTVLVERPGLTPQPRPDDDALRQLLNLLRKLMEP